MKRIVIAATAVAVLVVAATAYAAAFNNYTGSNLGFSKGAGTKAKPHPTSFVETLKANAPSGQRAAPLTNIKLTIYGAELNGGKFPACTDSMIEANKTQFEKACPKGSMIGQGPVHSLLGPQSSSAQSAGTACNPYLKVFNGGAHTQVFFFTTAPDAPSQYTCAGLTTGSTAPYDGHVSQQGKNLVVNVPLPPDISNKVANQPGLYGSLITETLTFPKTTKKVHGKTIGYMQSIACKGKTRPWSITYTAQNYDGSSDTQTVKGNAAC